MECFRKAKKAKAETAAKSFNPCCNGMFSKV